LKLFFERKKKYFVSVSDRYLVTTTKKNSENCDG